MSSKQIQDFLQYCEPLLLLNKHVSPRQALALSLHTVRSSAVNLYSKCIQAVKLEPTSQSIRVCYSCMLLHSYTERETEFIKLVLL